MEFPLIKIPIPGPVIELNVVSLLFIYTCAVFVDYYLYCCTTIPYQKYKDWQRLFHIVLPILFTPKIHGLSTSFIFFPWFIALVGAYSSQLYKQKYENKSNIPRQSFKNWVKSIAVEGLLEDKTQQPHDTVTKRKARLEGLKRMMIDIITIIIANRFINPLLLEDPRIFLTLPWYSFKCIYYAILMGFKGYALIQSNDLILSIPQVITGTKTIPAFNYPFLATSLIDFWGNRWNMVMKNIFHKQIFSKRPTSSAWERNLKGLQVFHMSGLMHEIIMTIVHREINLEQWLFFMIQGIAIYLQLNCIPRTFRERIPKPLSTILTILFLGCTGKLFLASFIRTEEYRQFLAKYSVI